MSQNVAPIQPPQLARAWTRFQNSLGVDEDPMTLPSVSETEAETEPETEPETDPWKDWEDYYGPEEDQVERQLNEELNKQFRDQLDLVYIMDD